MKQSIWESFLSKERLTDKFKKYAKERADEENLQKARQRQAKENSGAVRGDS